MQKEILKKGIEHIDYITSLMDGDIYIEYGGYHGQTVSKEG